VLLAVPRGPFRDSLRLAVRSLGFQTIETVNSVKDAINFLEFAEELPFWVLTTPQMDGQINCLQMLNLLLQTPELQHIKVSLFVEKSEMKWVAPAFELGLLSVHQVETRSIVEADSMLKTFVQRLGDNSHDACQVAAHYLRDHLIAEKSYQGLLELEQNLLRLNPKAIKHLIGVAEAQALLGNLDEARALLAQARYLDPALAKIADEVYQRYCGKETDWQPLSAVKLADLYQVTSCVIIDPDTTTHPLIEISLKGLGINTIHCHTTAEDALEVLAASGEPGMIIMEWKLSGLSAPAFLQRLRERGYCNVPIIVISSLVKATHKPLLIELGVSMVLDKPFADERFVTKLTAVLRANFMPTSMKALIRKVEHCLLTENVTEARKITNILAASTLQIPSDSLAFLEARVSFAEEAYDVAHRLVTPLIKNSPDNLAYQDLLGKILLKTGDYEAAVMCFKRANAIAPENIERLCGMAEAFVQLGDFDVANIHLKSARTIDVNSQHVLQTTVKLGLATNDIEAAKEAFSSVTSVRGILGYMNNQAVAFARSGRYDQGISLYNNTLIVLPPNHDDTLAVVHYNLGLAHLRKGDLVAAEKSFKEAYGMADKKLKLKVESILSKVQNALVAGTTLTLEQSAAATATQVALSDPEDAPIQPGKSCCHGLYVAVSGDDVKPLTAKPAYRKRAALQRGNTTSKRTGYTS
jgi:tetratricopeptide (TPR) repeat protein